MTFDRPRLGWVAIAGLVASCAADDGAVEPARPPSNVARFDGGRALADVRRQVAMGPRIPGTDGHRRTSAWIAEVLRPLADEVTEDHFVAAGVPLTNVYARFRPSARHRILLCTHWDTRPRADRDPDPARRDQPVPGANDGASGTAVLIELARLFRARPPALGIDLVFFDGEDYGSDYTGGWSDVLLGSQRYAATYRGPPHRFGILLDMVGDRDLCFPPEENSRLAAQWLVDLVWGVARELGHEAVFLDRRGPAIIDDHLPLIMAGMPVIDIIDLDYDAWHTVADQVDQVSAESLEVIGSVVAEVVYRERP